MGKQLDDLNEEELSFYQKAQKDISKQPPTLAEQVEMLDDLTEKMILELVEIRTDDQKDTFFKARIKNALMMRNSLTASEKARKFYEKLAERTQ